MTKLVKSVLGLAVAGVCFSPGVRADEHEGYDELKHYVCFSSKCRCCDNLYCTGWHQINCKFGEPGCSTHGEDCAFTTAW